MCALLLFFFLLHIYHFCLYIFYNLQIICNFSHDFSLLFLHTKFFHVVFLGCHLLDGCCTVFTYWGHPSLLLCTQPFVIVAVYYLKYFIIWHIIFFQPSFNTQVQDLDFIAFFYIGCSRVIRVISIGHLISYPFVVSHHPLSLDLNIAEINDYYHSK